MLGIKKKIKPHTVTLSDRIGQKIKFFLQHRNILLTLIHQLDAYINIQKLSLHTIQISKYQTPDLTD
jgi:hypothetical protein